MIYGRHTGINVRSLGEALRFYHDLLGLHIDEVRTEQPGEYIDTLTGIKGTVQHWAKVRTDDGYILELVEWVEPVDEQSDLRCIKIRYNWPGINHVCFRIDNADALHARFLGREYRCGKVQTDPPGKVKNFHAYDPDGNIVEFVEVLEPNTAKVVRCGGTTSGGGSEYRVYEGGAVITTSSGGCGVWPPETMRYPDT